MSFQASILSPLVNFSIDPCPLVDLLLYCPLRSHYRPQQAVIANASVKCFYLPRKTTSVYINVTKSNGKRQNISISALFFEDFTISTVFSPIFSGNLNFRLSIVCFSPLPVNWIRLNGLNNPIDQNNRCWAALGYKNGDFIELAPLLKVIAPFPVIFPISDASVLLIGRFCRSSRLFSSCRWVLVLKIAKK